ncbi:TruB pseudouridine (psi) synthase 1 [Sorochytrium milnesiophthora]
MPAALFSRLNGAVIGVSKPLGLSSAQVVSRVKQAIVRDLREHPNAGDAADGKQKLWKSVKVGHGGTLVRQNHLRTLIGIGTGTKRLASYLGCDKEYIVHGKLGTATATYDSEGSVVEEQPYEHVTAEAIQQALAKYRGTIMQTPPIYSALKHKGQPLYLLARQGRAAIPEVPPRPVTIHAAEMLAFTAATGTLKPSFELRVVCGRGTYIRSLVHDIGHDVGSCAHVSMLHRTRQGDWPLGLCLPEDQWTLSDMLQALDRHARTSKSK